MADSEKRKITLQVTELYDAQAEYISIVPRGANRLPFRIKKEDTTMINLDLSGLFRVKKQAEPTVLGVLVPVDQADGYIRTLKADHPEAAASTVAGNEEVAFIALDGKTGIDLGKTTIMKSSNDKAIVLTNVKKAMVSWEFGSDFASQIDANAFMPTLHVAVDTLMDVIWKIKTDTASQANFAADIGNAIDEFKAYVLGQVAALPVTVFKMDKLTPTAAPAEGDTTVVKTEAAAETTDKEVETEDDTTKAAAGTEVPADDTVADDTVAGAEADDAPTSVAKADADTEDQLTIMKQAMDLMTSLGQKVDSFHSRLDTMEGNVTQAVKKAEKAAFDASKASSFVLGDAINSEDTRAVTTTVVAKKSDLGALANRPNVENI